MFETEHEHSIECLAKDNVGNAEINIHKIEEWNVAW